LSGCLTASTFLGGLPKNVHSRRAQDTWSQELLDLVAETMIIAGQVYVYDLLNRQALSSL
jgi:hypothetical protein